MMSDWTHNGLLADLAEHLAAPERMLWVDMQLGPSGSPRPDAYTIAKSYTKPRPMAYEIKVSVSDFRSDVTGGKWQSYLKYAQGVVFCVPQGLIAKDDLPPTCGLMVRGDNGWRTVKKPTLAPVNLRFDVMQKLLIDGVRYEYKMRRKAWRGEYAAEKAIRQRLGNDVADAVRDIEQIRSRIASLAIEEKAQQQAMQARTDKAFQDAKQRAERDLKELAPLHDELCSILGLPSKSRYYQISTALADLRQKISVDETVAHALMCLGRSKAEIEKAIDAVTPPKTVALEVVK